MSDEDIQRLRRAAMSGDALAVDAYATEQARRGLDPDPAVPETPRTRLASFLCSLMARPDSGGGEAEIEADGPPLGGPVVVKAGLVARDGSIHLRVERGGGIAWLECRRDAVRAWIAQLGGKCPPLDTSAPALTGASMVATYRALADRGATLGFGRDSIIVYVESRVFLDEVAFLMASHLPGYRYEVASTGAARPAGAT